MGSTPSDPMPKQITLPAIPNVSDPSLQQYIEGLHAVVANLVTATATPNAPKNATVTPVAGGNVIQFTRSNAVSYNLYAGNTPDRGQAAQVNLGTANIYTDNVGQGGVTRYYWVEGLNQSGLPSTVTPIASGTTLALDTPAAPLPVVAQSYAQVFDTILGRLRPVISTVDTTVAGQPTPKD